MKLVTSWDPFKELDTFQDRLASMFGHDPSKMDKGNGNQLVESENWRPIVDIAEDENAFTITAELPEIPKENVKVTVENGVLNISGERKIEKEEKKKKYHRIERSYGSFSRSFTLADNVDAENIKADYKKGLLKIVLPKSETAKTKAIEVEVS